MEKVILLRYGEIYLKGRNRGFFERLLLNNIKKSIEQYNCILKVSLGRYFVEGFDEDDVMDIVDKLKKVSGLYSLSVCYKLETDLQKLCDVCNSVAPKSGSFRVTVKRADKRLPMTSVEIAGEIGGYLLEHNPELKVDLHNPEKEIHIDIRENGESYVYFDNIPCMGGMPVGSSGRALCLLSGGIDSPVALYRMAKRGLRVDAIHFHSFPYTSLMAKEKVLDLAKIVSEYSGSMRVYVVKFTEIQREIHEKCPAEFMITIMRRIMMRIAERVAEYNGCGSIVTGESLAQVASQTQESITVTNAVIEKLPVFRPLIGMDKEEIIETAKQIGTFETSILPYEDCCTVFLPKNPVIRPRLEIIEKAESKLDYESLIKTAIEEMEIIEI